MFESFHNNPLLTWINPFLSEHPGAYLYVVGGAVRDELRGRPGGDLDLVISGVSAEVLEAWLSLHGTVSFVGKRFGVWKFAPHHDPRNPTIDIALPRKDVSVGESGGYRQFLIESDPTIPIEEDLARRDFTVNAIAYDWRDEKLVDPFGGQEDISRQVIRAVGDPFARLKEDSTRILRALRFAATLHYTIEPKTWDALVALVPRLHLEVNGKRVVPRESMAEEFLKTLTANPARCIELYSTSGAWNELFPRRGGGTPPIISALFRNDSVPVRKPSSELLLSLLCFSTFPTVHETYDWLHLWKFEMLVDTRRVVEVVRVARIDPKAVSLAKIERHLLPIKDLLLPFLRELARADALPIATAWMQRLLEIERGTSAPRTLSAEEVKETGIPDGPALGEALDKLRSAEIAGEVKTKEAAREYLRASGENGQIFSNGTTGAS